MTRKRYFMGTDHQGQAFTLALEVDTNSPADQASPERLAKVYGLERMEEISAARYAVTKKACDHATTGGRTDT